MLIEGISIGSAYIAPKLIEYMIQRTNVQGNSLVFKINKTIKEYFSVRDVFAKNAWIFLVVLMVLKSIGSIDHQSSSLPKKLAFVSSLCSSSWLIRFSIGQALKNRCKPMAAFISPTSFQIERKPLTGIPQRFEKDPVFRLFSCAIGLAPIRRVAMDPNGKTLYERNVLFRWVIQNPTSPVTREPIYWPSLNQAPAIRAIIDHRLAFLNEMDGEKDE